MLYYASSIRDTLKELDTSEYGLPSSEARERLRLAGKNTFDIHAIPLWKKVFAPFTNIFTLVLICATVISFLMGAVVDSSMILIIVVVSVAIYYIQHIVRERVLRAFKHHQTKSILTMRDGTPRLVRTDELVKGDVIVLHEGERVPADARLITTRTLRVNESQLTGERLPIVKQIDRLPEGKDIHAQTNMLSSGSFIVSGDAEAVITATGNKTEFGHIATLAGAPELESPIERRVNQAITWIISIIVAIAVVAFTLALARGMSITGSVELVIALSVSAVPESLPVVVAVILVLGMRRMATKKLLVRTIRSMETVGTINAIVTDKTGILTLNQPEVVELWHPEGSHARTRTSLLHAINKAEENYLDPLDQAAMDFLTQQGVALPSQPPLLSLPFEQTAAMSGNIWHSGSEYSLYIKGAPEHILHRSDLTESEHEQALARLHSLAGNGYRVMALAHTTLKKPIASFADLAKKERLIFDGFATISDQLRPEAKAAIATAAQAGIRTYMVTGDHYETAFHVGKELGIVRRRDEVFDARHMSTMSDGELTEAISSAYVFAHATPEHKYRILSLLKERGSTAITGDGVSDVPVLTDAHVGFALGSGAQIAKDAGDIVLVDGSFKGVIDAIREGRVILSNIRRVLIYLLATNIGEVLITLSALAFAIPIPLLPAQILWVNLVTDSLLAVPLGLEPGGADILRRTPQQANGQLFDARLILRTALIALTMAFLTLGLYLFYAAHYGTSYGRTVAFSSLVIMQWASAIALRSDGESVMKRLRTHNKVFYSGLAIAITLQFIVLFGPFGSALQVARISPMNILISGAIAFFVPLLIIGGRKYMHRFSRKRHTS